MNSVIVLMDFRGYFASILIEYLRKEYLRYINDERIVDLICAFSPKERGLSLGNESSQIPASYFPSKLDHYFKDELGLKYFCRFMDDTMFVAPDMAHAQMYVREYKTRAENMGLTVPDEKIRLIKIGQNFVYCKERFIYNPKCGDYYRLINPKIYI